MPSHRGRQHHAGMRHHLFPESTRLAAAQWSAAGGGSGRVDEDLLARSVLARSVLVREALVCAPGQVMDVAAFNSGTGAAERTGPAFL